MAYSELIKNFSKIREYMSQFYIYGFKSRNEYTSKSARSYDNERRRMESWFGEYMSFRQDANGRNTFIAVDSRSISHNPLYNAFKAKSFTDNDIMLHFYIAYLHLYFDGNCHMARLIHMWFLIQKGYESTLFVPFSSCIEKSRKNIFIHIL